LAGFLLAVIVLHACNGSQGNGMLSSTGRGGEVLVVCSDKQWKGELGDSLQAILMQYTAILPQYEPMFSLSHVSAERFNEIYQKQRNIIILSIDPSLEKGKAKVERNQWVSPQLVMRISANSAENLIAEVSARQEVIIKYLIESEMSRYLKLQKRGQDFRKSQQLEKKFNISLVVPEDFIFAVKDSNFCWLRRDIELGIQNIMIYTQDYVSTSQFSQKHIVQLRDSLTKRYVFGSVDSSYATTEKKYLPPEVKQCFSFENIYAVRTVGLWEMEGESKGGPFVSFTLLDEARNRVITLDAFLYAPGEKKRDMLRQLEAVLLGVRMR